MIIAALFPIVSTHEKSVIFTTSSLTYQIYKTTSQLQAARIHFMLNTEVTHSTGLKVVYRQQLGN